MSKGDASKDPVHFKVKVNTGPARDETVIAGLSELGQLARHAFEDKRRKQCLALTTAILKIDPENREALVIQAWVREDLVKDVNSAKQQVQEARRESSLGLWDRAERLLRGVINVDPDHEEAKALLAEVIPAQQALAEANPIEDAVVSEEGKGSKRSRLIALTVFGTLAAALVIFFVFRPPKLGSESETNKETPAEPSTPATAETSAPTGSFEFYVLPQTGVQVSVDDAPPQPVPQKIDLSPGPHSFVFTSQGYLTQTLSEIIVAGRSRVVPVVMKASSTAANPPDKTSTTPPKNEAPPKNSSPPSRGSASAPPQGAPTRPTEVSSGGESEGSLAIGAAVPVDVYWAGKALGTTPITVKLPTGAQTLEFRFQDQIKTASYIIRANETSKTSVAFDVTIRINASPWAQVSIEGPEGRALGETPLSNVLVPAGSVLVFQFPGFPEQRVRVTGKNPVSVHFP